MTGFNRPNMDADRSLQQRTQVTKPLLKYNMSPSAMTSNMQPHSMKKPVSAASSQATASMASKNKPPSMPFFNPAELHFLKHFAKTQQTATHPTSSGQGQGTYHQPQFNYKPRLLSAYTFLSSSASDMSSSPVSASNGVGKQTQDLYSQPYIAKTFQDEFSYRMPPSLFNVPLSSPQVALHGLNTLSGSNLGSNASSRKYVPVNSFMRPVSTASERSRNSRASPELHSSSGMSMASQLDMAVVVESKPVSISDQEEEEEQRKLVTKKQTPTMKSSMPRPPSNKTRANAPEAAFKPNALIKSYALEKSSIDGKQKAEVKDSKTVAGEVKVGRASVGHIYQSPVMMTKPVTPPSMVNGMAAPHPPSRTAQSSAKPRQSSQPLHTKSSTFTVHSTRAIQSEKTLPDKAKESKSKPIVISHGKSTSVLMVPRPPSDTPDSHMLKNNADRPSEVEGSKPNSVSLSSNRKNLNYTPTKPYCEINMHQPNIQSTQLPGSPAESSDSHKVRPKTPTVFYRKGAKPEEIRQELKRRPTADGAVADAVYKETTSPDSPLQQQQANDADDDDNTSDDEKPVDR